MAYRLLGSLPIVGEILTLIWDVTATAIDQHGMVLGLMKGGLISVIVALAMFALSEGVTLIYQLGGVYKDEYVKNPIVGDIKARSINRDSKDGPSEELKQYRIDKEQRKAEWQRRQSNKAFFTDEEQR